MLNEFNKPLTDHYIQADILNLLTSTTRPLTFSEIKPPEVENSLFMYHVRKITRRGIIEKTPKGYGITTKGIRWINYIGTTGNNLISKPKLLTQFIYKHDNQILLGKRLGREAEVFNKYMLPGSDHLYGESADESIKRIVEKFNIKMAQCRLLCFLEAIINTNDEYIHHSFSHIYEIKSSDIFDSLALGKYDYDWHNIDNITKNDANSYDQIVTNIISKWQNNQLALVEFVKIDYTK